ncbi:MAG: methionyl-tRNA formyltransferase [Anaerovoracaceae bacterium]
MKIVFMGTPDFAVPSLEALVSAGHEVALVVTRPDKKKDRGKKVHFTPVKEKALMLNLPVSQPETLVNNERFMEKLIEISPDLIVLVAYGKILPKDVLALPKYGALNVHASILPRHRGAAPIQHAILQGDEVGGVTIMQMNEGLDQGDMIANVKTLIGGYTKDQLHDELMVKGAELLVEILPSIEDGTAIFLKQDEALATYAPAVYKEMGRISFDRSAQEIERLIRAMDSWPGAYCNYKDKLLKIWSGIPLEGKSKEPHGTIVDVSEEGIKIACKNSYLLATVIQLPGKKRMAVKDFLKGNSIEKGLVLM